MKEKIKKFVYGKGASILALVLAVTFAVNSVNAIVHNWRLQRQITRLGSEVALLRAENERLTYDISYYKTEQYLEQALRAKLNLKAPGEKVAVVAHGGDRPLDSRIAIDTNKPEQQQKSNWQSWMDFINGRAN